MTEVGTLDNEPPRHKDRMTHFTTTGRGRGHGYTGTMVAEAVAEAKDKKTVLVLVRDKNEETRVLAMIDAATREIVEFAGIRERIVVRAYEDLTGGMLRGRRFNHVLEDHEVAEARESRWREEKLAVTGSRS